jgi:uncharacterized damage-inducible protein DinB
MVEVQLDDHGRPEPPLAADEVATVLGFLDYQRATLAWKCRDLTDEQLRSPLHPTTMTLAGMLRHMARVEDGWFTDVVAERGVPQPWASMPWGAEWAEALTMDGAQLRRDWQEAVDRSRAVVARELAAGPEGIDRTHAAWGGEGHPSLRWVLVHMIEEYARHNGHADLLREAIDGQTGE